MEVKPVAMSSNVGKVEGRADQQKLLMERWLAQKEEEESWNVYARFRLPDDMSCP